MKGNQRIQGAFMVLWLLAILRATPVQGQTLHRYEYSQPKMGTTFRIVLFASGSAVADSAAVAAFRRIDELNLIFSDYREDSEVSKLSQTAGTGQKIPVSPELWEVIVFSGRLSKKSKGAFDISVGPLSKLWRRAFRQQEFPEITQIKEAGDLVGYRQIKCFKKGHRVQLRRSGMRLDLGGIAKGYTVDAVFQILEAHGIQQALVDGGGDIYAGDAPPGTSGWEIEWFSPEKKIRFIANQAIASSGSTYKFLEWNGKKYSHIIDPRTGLGITETAIINVSAGNCMVADAFASALSVLDRPGRMKLLRAFPDVKWLDDGR